MTGGTGGGCCGFCGKLTQPVHNMARANAKHPMRNLIASFCNDCTLLCKRYSRASVLLLILVTWLLALTPSSHAKYRRGGGGHGRTGRHAAPEPVLTFDPRDFDTVIVDAGHGGVDPGGIPGQRVLEKPLTLNVAQRVEKLLRKDGFRTVMTRNSDVFIPLEMRTAIASQYTHAIFISIHFNSMPMNPYTSGIETYYYSSYSQPLAWTLHTFILRATGLPDRGIRRRALFVLHHHSLPAVLIEGGYLTNPIEARGITSLSYRQALSQSIAQAILAYKMSRF